MVEIKFAKLHPSTKIPQKNSEDAGLDIYANFKEDYIIIKPHETVMIPTKLISECPKEYYFQLFERGSTGTKGMAQRCGVIDSGFKGEWFVPITNTNQQPIYIIKEHCLLNLPSHVKVIFYPYEKAICQAVVLPVPEIKIKETSVDEIKNTKSIRGEGKLGSSNK